MKDGTSVTVTQGMAGGMGNSAEGNGVIIEGGTVNISRYTTTLSGLIGAISYGGDAKNKENV